MSVAKNTIVSAPSSTDIAKKFIRNFMAKLARPLLFFPNCVFTKPGCRQLTVILLLLVNSLNFLVNNILHNFDFL